MFDSLQIMNALQDAWVILAKAKSETSSGTHPVWKKLNHAQGYLDGQMEILLSDSEDSSPSLPEAEAVPVVVAASEDIEDDPDQCMTSACSDKQHDRCNDVDGNCCDCSCHLSSYAGGAQ